VFILINKIYDNLSASVSVIINITEGYISAIGIGGCPVNGSIPVKLEMMWFEIHFIIFNLD